MNDKIDDTDESESEPSTKYSFVKFEDESDPSVNHMKAAEVDKPLLNRLRDRRKLKATERYGEISTDNTAFIMQKAESEMIG